MGISTASKNRIKGVMIGVNVNFQCSIRNVTSFFIFEKNINIDTRKNYASKVCFVFDGLKLNLINQSQRKRFAFLLVSFVDTYSHI